MKQSKTWCIRVSKYRYKKDESGNPLPSCPDNWDLITEIKIDTIIEALRCRFERVRYCFEVGSDTGMPHWHILAQNDNKSVRFDTIKTIVPYGRIETWRRGAKLRDYLDYMDKDEEAKGDPREAFTEPVESLDGYTGKGCRTDWLQVREQFSAGASIDEVIAEYPHLSLNIGALEKLRATILGAKWRTCLRKDIEVVYIYGEAGTGKSRYVLETEGLGNVYRVTDYKHPFDGYEAQSAICFEEFRNSLPFEQMLNYLDIYPIELPSRYANKPACFQRVYIVSNWSYEEQYKQIRENHSDSIRAWDRRIHYVYKFDESGQRHCLKSPQYTQLKLDLGKVIDDEEGGTLPY